MANLPASPFTHTEASLLPVLHQLLAREPIFHRPDVASKLDDFDRLLAPGYWEAGASGRRYSRAFILDHLARHPPIDAGHAGWRVLGPACRQLAPGIFLLTYTLHQDTRVTRRATLWQSAPPGFQALYHQGTLVAASEDDMAP